MRAQLARAPRPSARASRPARRGGHARPRRAWCRASTASSSACGHEAWRVPARAWNPSTDEREDRRVAADLGERAEPGVPVERGVLDALRHHGARRLLEPPRAPRAQDRRARARAPSIASARSGRRADASAAAAIELLATGRQVRAVDREAREQLGEGVARLRDPTGAVEAVAHEPARPRHAWIVSAIMRFVSWIRSGHSARRDSVVGSGRRRARRAPLRRPGRSAPGRSRRARRTRWCRPSRHHAGSVFAVLEDLLHQHVRAPVAAASRSR